MFETVGRLVLLPLDLWTTERSLYVTPLPLSGDHESVLGGVGIPVLARGRGLAMLFVALSTLG